MISHTAKYLSYRVQNAATRLVGRCHRCSHETALAPSEITSSVLSPATGVVCTSTAQHGLAPPYITDLLEQRATRVLHSTTNNDLYVPPSRSRYGERMFSVAGPWLWNSLPADKKKTCWVVTFETIENPSISGCVWSVDTYLSLYLICISFLPIYYLVHVVH